MIFQIIDKEKNKTKRKRQKYEKNFRVFKIIEYVSLILSVFFVPKVSKSDDGIGYILYMCGVMFFLSLAFIMHVAKSVLSGTHVTDMFKEQLELNDNSLIHAFNLSAGGGYSAGFEGSQRKIEEVRFKSITKCLIDEKTGRIEIFADTVITILNGNFVQTQRAFPDYRLIMYDYYQPSLIAELEKRDIPIQKTSIIYKINEMPEEYKGMAGRRKLHEDIKAGKDEWI